MHGNSGGSAANPVAFADAIRAASEEFGPFSAAVGHSMGCVGLAIARDLGVEIPCYALIASPANMQETLQAFADFTCLPKQPAELFIRGVGEQVGRAAVELDVGDLLSQHQPNLLLLHSEDDLEVPFNAAETIQRKLPGTDIFRASGVGHRRIIQDPEVISVVSHFLLNSLEKVPDEWFENNIQSQAVAAVRLNADAKAWNPAVVVLLFGKHQNGRVAWFVILSTQAFTFLSLAWSVESGS